jgi:arsenate reductase
MAESLLRLIGGSEFEVVSAGTDINKEVNPFALEVLEERGADIEGLHPKKVYQFLGQPFDLVITVCDNAKNTCPHFPGNHDIYHWSLEDPAAFQGTHEEILTFFRETRDEIERRIRSSILGE